MIADLPIEKTMRSKWKVRNGEPFRTLKQPNTPKKKLERPHQVDGHALIHERGFLVGEWDFIRGTKADGIRQA